MCLQMMFIKNKKQSEWQKKHNPKYDYVPCGKCPECLASRASAWSFRLMQEEKTSKSAHFITLTYDTKHLPITENGYGSINKRDLQLFFKRLRKANKANTLKYYAVGEYGGKLKRPHYHIILFNASLRTINPAWSLGHAHFGTVTGASVGYTLKYISKPYRNFKLNDDREKPFSVMSKKLGQSYINKMARWHKADLENRMYCNIEGGKKCTMPRYYKDRIYTDADREKIKSKARQRFAESILNDLLQFSNEELDKRSHNKREGKEALRRKQLIETGVDENYQTYQQKLSKSKKISYAKN